MLNKLDISKALEGQTLTMKLAGRIDTQTSPELETTIKDSLDGVMKLVLDFAEVEYISSAGLRVLLASHKLMMPKEGLEIHNINQAVADIFEVTGFSSILDIK